MSPKQRFNITLESDHIVFLRIMEKATGASASEHIRRAIALYIESLAPQLRDEIEAEGARRELVRTAKEGKKKERTGGTRKRPGRR